MCQYARLSFVSCLAILGLALPASALELNLLWYDNAPCFVGGPNVVISGACGGDLVSPHNAFGPIELSNYSRTWYIDTDGAQIGDTRQLDLYLTVSNLGLMATGVSVRYDQAGTSVLDAIAARQYNIGHRPTDGSYTNCQPFNSCTRNVVTGTALPQQTTHVIADAGPGPGEVKRFGSLISPGSPALGTKQASQTAVFRMGSIIFELTSAGETDVVGALGTGEIFVLKNTNVQVTTSGDFVTAEPVYWNASVRFTPPTAVVDIDIRPWSETNWIKLSPYARIPVAILGSEIFDVDDVDTDTVVFGPNNASPSDPEATFQWDVNGDDHSDLVLIFRSLDTGIGAEAEEACLSGETLGGIPFSDCDDVWMLEGCGLGFELALLLPGCMWLRGRRKRSV